MHTRGGSLKSRKICVYVLNGWPLTTNNDTNKVQRSIKGRKKSRCQWAWFLSRKQSTFSNLGNKLCKSRTTLSTQQQLLLRKAFEDAYVSTFAKTKEESNAEEQEGCEILYESIVMGHFIYSKFRRLYLSVVSLFPFTGCADPRRPAGDRVPRPVALQHRQQVRAGRPGGDLQGHHGLRGTHRQAATGLPGRLLQGM